MSLGAETWGTGPSAVVVWLPSKWVVGTLVNSIWSYAGSIDREQVNTMTLQYCVNYNIAGGWYLSTSPIISANWEADRTADISTVPLGGGFGKLWRLGPPPVNTHIQAFWNAETPRHGATWALRKQVQFMFPN